MRTCPLHTLRVCSHPLFSVFNFVLDTGLQTHSDLGFTQAIKIIGFVHLDQHTMGSQVSSVRRLFAKFLEELEHSLFMFWRVLNQRL